MGKMLARLEPDGHGPRHFEPKHMLGVMRRARWVAMTPARENLINVLQLPIDDTAISIGVDTCLLMQLACRRLRQCLARLLAACHRLPVTGIIGTLEQQHAQVGRAHQHQCRDRNFEGHRASTRPGYDGDAPVNR